MPALLLLAGIITFAGCGEGGRPDVSDWATDWEALIGTIPTLDKLGSPPDYELCGHALGDIREGQAELLPTPDLALDPVVREWFTVAEDAMFECPPSSSRFPDLEYVYQELARLEAEVTAVLAMAGEDG
jgi:hypothetical protein